MVDHVAIVGAGFSGSLAAINLVRHGGLRATLIDRRAQAGAGLAYGAAHPEHLLNVRAANMSALPDDPGHFVRWLEADGGDAPAGRFVPRLRYGAYLRDLLEQAAADSPGRLAIVRGEAAELATQDGVHIKLADGGSVRADAAILAVGNLPPPPPSGIQAAALPPGRYVGDCWSAGATDGLGAGDTVLILGTGLTMVDVALSLDVKGFAGRIVAMSRRGLLPHAHAAPAPPWEPIKDRPATALAGLVRRLRQRSAEIGWRQAIDELRPFTQDMWRVASPAERARFIRHARPWWDIHRHRLAPEVAARIVALRASGRLRIAAGKIRRTTDCGDGVAVDWRPRGRHDPKRLVVQRIINCTGPQGDIRNTTEPLLAGLVAGGVIRPDRARLGIDVDERMRTIAADSRANDRLFALGPMTRGAFWEIVAVPDIRTQAATLARQIAGACRAD